jgi:hypothetical protein
MIFSLNRTESVFEVLSKSIGRRQQSSADDITDSDRIRLVEDSTSGPPRWLLSKRVKFTRKVWLLEVSCSTYFSTFQLQICKRKVASNFELGS